jgi:hypothetical protein
MLPVLLFFVRRNFKIPTGGRNEKNNNTCNLTMATASDPYIFINTTQLLDCFCSWVHYNLLNPPAKRIEQLATSCHENVFQRNNHASGGIVQIHIQ